MMMYLYIILSVIIVFGITFFIVTRVCKRNVDEEMYTLGNAIGQ